MNNKSNEIWKNEKNYNNWELRKHRFTDEMRPVFFQYLGINPDSYVLDDGCGTGVFTRYLAKGLKGGRIMGFDISKYLVEYGKEKVKEENLSDVCELVEADGLHLPINDNTFDAVTNYTYLGVLSDPAAGLKEMIRVCKVGGTVSSVLAGITSVTWKGEYQLDFIDRLNELYEKQEAIYKKYFLKNILGKMYYQTNEWPNEKYPKLFDMCGLKEIHIYPFGAGFSYNDERWPLEYRKLQVETGISEQIRIIKDRSEIKEFEKYGFTKTDFDELIELLRKKQKYLLENLESDKSFEYAAALNLILTGVK